MGVAAFKALIKGCGMQKIILMMILAVVSNSVLAADAVTTYDLILKGKVCKEGFNQQMDCDYRIGNDFWLSIAGVGSSDAGVTLMKSDFNGMYYGTIGMLHGCVIVKIGAKNKSASLVDLAFVSPNNGKVYKDWRSCKVGQ